MIRSLEHIFGDRSKERFAEAGASVRCHHDCVFGVLYFCCDRSGRKRVGNNRRVERYGKFRSLVLEVVLKFFHGASPARGEEHD